MKAKFRGCAILSLCSASMCAIIASAQDQNLCLYQYSGYPTLLYFSEMNGFTADQPFLITFMGMIGIIFFSSLYIL